MVKIYTDNASEDGPLKEKKNQNLVFAKRLRNIREYLDMSQKDMAVLLDESKSKISEYESGKHAPGLDSLSIISEKLDVDMNYLFGKTDQMFFKQENNVKYKMSKINPENDEDMKRFFHVFKKSAFVRFWSIGHCRNLLIFQKEAVLEEIRGKDENFKLGPIEIEVKDNLEKNLQEILFYFETSSFLRFNTLGDFTILLIKERTEIEKEIKEFEEKEKEKELKIEPQDSTLKSDVKTSKKKVKSKRKNF